MIVQFLLSNGANPGIENFVGWFEECLSRTAAQPRVRVDLLEIAMRNRTQGILAFAAILTSCTAGIFHLTWWAALAGACVLALISLSNHHSAYRVLSGGEGTAGVLLFSSFFNATIVSAAALSAGRVLGWVWGV